MLRLILVAPALAAVLQCSSPGLISALVQETKPIVQRQSGRRFQVSLHGRCRQAQEALPQILGAPFPRPTRLCATSRRGGEVKSAPVNEASRLHQELASREAKRQRRKRLKDDAPRLNPRNDIVVAAVTHAELDGEQRQRSRMRLRLEQLDGVDIHRHPRAARTAKTKTKLKREELKTEDAEKERAKIESDLSRLKLRLAEAKRDVEAGELRAKEAERRLEILSQGLTLPVPIPEKGRNDTIESVLLEGAAQIEEVKLSNRRRLQEFEAAAGREKRALRNRAWSAETELNKQQMICIVARKEADQSILRTRELEVQVLELEKLYSSRMAALEREARKTKSLIAQLRRRIALKMLSMRSAFRREITQKKDEAQAQEESVREVMKFKIRSVEEVSRKEMIRLRRETVDAIAKEKKEKYDSIRQMREEYDSYSHDVEEQIHAETESANNRIQELREETNRRLEEARTASREERRNIWRDGERALAEATNEATRQIYKLRKEINQKAEAGGDEGTEQREELVELQTAMAKHDRDRNVLKKVANAVRKMLRNPWRFRRRKN